METQMLSDAEGKIDEVPPEKLQRLLEMKEFIAGPGSYVSTKSFDAHVLEAGSFSCGACSCSGGGGGSCGSCRVTELNS